MIAGNAFEQRLIRIRDLIQSLPHDEALEAMVSAQRHGWTIETLNAGGKLVVVTIDPPNHECAMLGHEWQVEGNTIGDAIDARCLRCDLVVRDIDEAAYVDLLYGGAR